MASTSTALKLTTDSIFRYRDFIIEEAEVDSDVDEDDEYEDAVGEIGIVGNEVEESGQTAREIENRRRMVMLWE